jgi:cation diffusion facilitator CzcD-associated flavoprotein CzcO
MRLREPTTTPSGNIPESEDTPSAIYDSLITNIPHPVMAYNKFPFPPSTYLFPPAAEVLEYHKGYARNFGLLPYVRLNSKVVRCVWRSSEWKLTLESGEEHIFDKIVIANGHYFKPYVPPIPGLTSWVGQKRGLLHAARYREPSKFTGRRVLVIGNGPSGTDIGDEISHVAQETYLAGRNLKRSEAGLLKFRSAVTAVSSVDGTAVYEDGTADSGIDDILLATGYEYRLESANINLTFG